MKNGSIGKPPMTTKDKTAMVVKRYGADTGANSAGKAKPTVKVRPSGNPLKGKVGVKVKVKY